jgi:hypothetical protein
LDLTGPSLDTGRVAVRRSNFFTTTGRTLKPSFFPNACPVGRRLDPLHQLYIARSNSRRARCWTDDHPSTTQAAERASALWRFNIGGCTSSGYRR